MLKKKYIVMGIFILICIAIGCWLYKLNESPTYISRAAAAKALALLEHNVEECISIEIKKISDVGEDLSFTPYICTVVEDEIMSCDGEYFYPMKMLTYKDLWQICEKLGLPKEELSFNFSRLESEEYVPVKHWQEVLEAANATRQTLERKSAVLYGTSSTISDLEPWTCSTSEGIFYFTGLSLDAYINKRIDFYMRDNEIACFIGVIERKENEERMAALLKENLADGSDQSLPENELYNFGDASDQTIRVVLNTDGYSGLLHGGVTLTCDGDYTVSFGDQTENHAVGDIFDLVPGDMRFQSGSVNVIPVSSENKIQILSISRNQGHPCYRGKIELSLKDGAIVIVNELLLEEYLYGVLPSEMPVSFGVEALKVQAVCARSFAYTSLSSSQFSEFGADLDDSTSSQVYQNLEEQDIASQAVDATRGQVLCADNEIVRTYFFSTSCGVTSDVSDVWNGNGQSYLVPVFQLLSGEETDLSLEDNFRHFIDLNDGKTYYESDVSWFRWNVVLDSTDVATGFGKVSANFKSGVVNGTIADVEVTERGKSGIAKEIAIYSAGGVATVKGEYSIRTTLSVAGKTINCHDGTQVTNQIMLPSGYIYIDSDENGNIIIHGGGFGHGVGMSQNGAAAMCNAGMDYEQVLRHFFAGTEIEMR